MAVLQTGFPEVPGTFVAIELLTGGALWRGVDSAWRVMFWDRSSLDTDLTQDGFPTLEEARAWAECEFNIRRDDWIESERIGSSKSIAEIVDLLFARRLTCDEAAAVACLAYNYVFLDERGLVIFPGDESCCTSFNVVADVLDQLPWEHGECSLFATNSQNHYGFVSDVVYNQAIVEASEEFRLLMAAFTATPTVRTCMPENFQERSGFDRFLSGYLWQNLKGPADTHVIPARTDSAGDDRLLYLTSGSPSHIVLEVGQYDAELRYYRSSSDGVLQAAARRFASGPIVPLPLDTAVREEFAAHIEAYLQWRRSQPASTSVRVYHEAEGAGPAADVVTCVRCESRVAAVSAHVLPVHTFDEAGEGGYAALPACDRCWRDVLDNTVARVEALDEDSPDVFQLAALFRRYNVFIYEQMSGADSHVVKRVLLGMLREIDQERVRLE
jgi:hypothetical protein